MTIILTVWCFGVRDDRVSEAAGCPFQPPPILFSAVDSQQHQEE